MSLELLAKLLSFSRNQLNLRCKTIDQNRQNVLDQLQHSSGTVQRLLHDRHFALSRASMGNRMTDNQSATTKQVSLKKILEKIFGDEQLSRQEHIQYVADILTILQPYA